MIGHKVTARKEWACDYCEAIIKPGEKYQLEKGRGEVLDDNDEQVGIKYWTYRYCLKDGAPCYEKDLEYTE